MVSENKDAFDNFTRLHFEYSTNEEKYQDKFNIEGQKIQEIVREYENRLCANTERGMYNKFSAGLSEKFQNEVRSHYPLINHIGIKVKSAVKFQIKKINLKSN